jgi:hypothetical protein
MARGVAASDLSNEFAEETHTYRGTTYVVRELSMAAYDRTVKAATVKDPVTGEESTDNLAHNKILLAKCVTVKGKPIDVDELYEGTGARAVRQLMRIIQKLHWEEEQDGDPVADDAGEATAEAS